MNCNAPNSNSYFAWIFFECLFLWAVFLQWKSLVIFQTLTFNKKRVDSLNKLKSLALLKNPKTSIVSPNKKKYRPATALKLEKSNPQVSDSDTTKVICKYCGGVCWKSGVEKTTGKQRYRCRQCRKSQQAQYSYNAYAPNLDQNIVCLTKEGVGILGTARLLGISPTTLISRIKKIAVEINEPVLAKGKTYEVDELRTFVKKKDD